METTALTPTGIAVTRLGFGCGSIMRLPSRRQRQELLGAVFEDGVRHFDVARMYGLGTAEAELAALAKGRRDTITIATKFGIEPRAAASRLARFQAPARRLLARFPALRQRVKRTADVFDLPHRYDVAAARASLERSLTELQTDYVDILLLHNPTAGDEVDDDICAYLETAREAGHVRAWGVSGEPQACAMLRRRFPVPIVSQMRGDIFSNPTDFDLAEPGIIFGVLTQALPRVFAHATASQQRRRRWSEAIGADCAHPSTIATLLLRDALCSRPDDVVLFATTRVEHARASMGSARDLDACLGDPGLTAFRALVAEELLPGS